jgi:hypothetical protein
MVHPLDTPESFVERRDLVTDFPNKRTLPKTFFLVCFSCLMGGNVRLILMGKKWQAVPRPWVVPAASCFSPPGFLSLTFLHLEDVSVAELLAQARDEADGVDVHADHLQPVLGVAGDLHRSDPCRHIHLHVRTGTNLA